MWPLAARRSFGEVGMAAVRRESDAAPLDACVTGSRVLAVCETLGDGRGGPDLTRAAADAIWRLDNDGDPGSVPALLAALGEANERVRRLIADSVLTPAWGCSVTVALLAGRRLIVACVGTTRCQVVRAGAPTGIVQDDTWSPAATGDPLDGDASPIARPRLPVQWLGHPHLAPQVREIPVRRGDLVALCSGAVDADIADACAWEPHGGVGPLDRIAPDIAHAALRSGTSDGASVVLGVVE